MRRTISLLIPAVLLLSAVATGAGLTGQLDPLEADLRARRAELAPSPDKAAQKTVKTIDKVLKAFEKDSVLASYSGELKGAAKAGKLVEKKLAGEAGLQADLGDAVAGYTDLLTAARNDMAAVQPGDAKADKKREKALKKADKGLAKAALSISPSKALKSLSGVAKVVEDFIRLDDGQTHTWVISEVVPAPAGVGRDLDGDGAVDNALGGLLPLLELAGIDVSQMIADQLANGEQVGLIQMWGIDSFDADPVVRAGLLNGVDTDADPSDNFSGAESFDAQAGALAVDGHPLLRTTTSFGAGGVYEVVFSGEAVAFVGFELPENVSYGIAGEAAAASNDGVIGFALPVQAILEFLAAAGIDLGFTTELLIAAATDIDLDGDGTNDAISTAFEFKSVPASIN